MPGVTSSASKAAQGKPTHVVTSNANGDLAAYTPSELGLSTSGDVTRLQTQINRLGSRDSELTEGIATVAALAQPVLLPGQHFAMRAGWGGFDDANAVGGKARLRRLSHTFFASPQRRGMIEFRRRGHFQRHPGS